MFGYTAFEIQETAVHFRFLWTSLCIGLRYPGQERMATLCLVTPLLIGINPGIVILLWFLWTSHLRSNAMSYSKEWLLCVLVTPPLIGINPGIVILLWSLCFRLRSVNKKTWIHVFGRTAFQVQEF